MEREAAGKTKERTRVGGKTRKGRGMTEERRRVAGGSEVRTKKRRRKKDTKEEKWDEETARIRGDRGDAR